MLNETLSMGYGIAQYTLEKNLEGISHEESMTPPGEGMNPINWVLGHIVVCRDLLLAELGKEKILKGEEGAAYNRGAKPMKMDDECLPLKALQDYLGKSSAALVGTINELGPSDFEKPIDPSAFPAPVEKPTLGALLTLFMFHESYHAGQVGTLRRLAGKEPQLR